MDNELKDLQEYILPIVKDEELLRVESEEVTTEEGEAIAVNLLTTLAHEQGVGLAAPQIGINKRVVAINVVEPFVLINPKIVEATGEVNYIEGCLSFPGKEVKTKRYTSIVVEWTPIAYTADTGGYEVYFSATSGGPYSFYDLTVNKSISIMTVGGLTPETMYYFIVQTVTNPHVNNQNLLHSEPSSEVSAATSAIVPGVNLLGMLSIILGISVFLVRFQLRCFLYGSPRSFYKDLIPAHSRLFFLNVICPLCRKVRR